MKKFAYLFALLAFAAACGKRAPLRPPSDDMPDDEQAAGITDAAAPALRALN